MVEISTRHLAADISKAASEALDNSLVLYAGGYFGAALGIARALVERGPWEVGKHGVLQGRLEDLLPFLSWLNGVDCAAVGTQPALAHEELDARAEEDAQAELGMLVMVDRIQQHAAGRKWSEAYFAGLPKVAAEDGTFLQLGEFLVDLSWVLKHRVRIRLALDSHPAEQEVLDTLASVAGFEIPQIQVAPEASAFPGHRLADMLESVARAFRKFGYIDSQCWMMLALLDLADGDEAAAAKQLSRGLSLGMDLYGLQLVRHWVPLRNLLASHALAPALKLDDSVVEDYLRAFHARPAMPARQAARMSWKREIAAFAAARARSIEGLSLDGHDPRSEGLRKSLQGGSVRMAGANSRAIRELEDRLGEKLPTSYVAFLKESDGLIVPDAMVNLLPSADVDWFAARNADWIRIWTEDGEGDIEDERYLTYGPDQDCVWIRPGYLRTALQVSDVIDSEVILLNPRIRFGDEWEAWYFAVHLPGAHRYRSFADLMRERVFADAPS